MGICTLEPSMECDMNILTVPREDRHCISLTMGRHVLGVSNRDVRPQR
jgi:hypothetical protein